MGILYDDRASSTATRHPHGHFSDPHPETTDFTILYFAGSPGPEYWICLVEVVQILPDKLVINIFKSNGHRGPNSVAVNLNALTEVFRDSPSTIDEPVAGQGPLTPGDCVILCVTEDIVRAAGIDSSIQTFGKHPYGGDAIVLDAFREMARRLKDEIYDLPAAAAAKRKYPNLFI